MASSDSEAGPSPISALNKNDVRRVSHGRGPLLDSDDEGPPDERSPLLASSRASQRSNGKTKRRVKAVACYACIALALLVALALVILHIVVGHIYHRRMEQESVQVYGRKALVFDGPQAIQLDAWEDDGVRATVRFRAGIDAAKALEEGKKMDWIERRLLPWGAKRMRSAMVEVPSAIHVKSLDGAHLATLPHLASFMLPIRWHPDGDWLQEVELPVHVRIPRPQDVAAFLNATLEARRADLRVSISEAKVSLSGAMSLTMSMAVNEAFGLDLPELPDTGDLSKLVELKSYSIAPLPTKQLGLTAHAIGINPLVNTTLPPLFQRALDSLQPPLDMPWHLPFSVAIKGARHSHITMAHVNVHPFSLSEGIRQPHVNVSLSGVFIPGATNSSSSALSSFLARFLLGLDNPVVIRYDPSAPSHHPDPPSFFTPLLNPYAVQLAFPGAPDDERQLLTDVTIESMKINIGDGNNLLASGRVVGVLSLPPELAGLTTSGALDITSVLPDVYVYDGAPPRSREGGSIPGDGRAPASNAFARLTPDNYLPARTEIRPIEGGKKNVTMVHAEMKDAPLEMLAGRSDVLRRYLAKLLLGGGDGPEGKVKTGVKGVVGVDATLEGFGDVELEGLPVEGVFYVGRDDAHL